MKNARYRLEHLSGAAVAIESKPGEGCLITIDFPQKEEKRD